MARKPKEKVHAENEAPAAGHNSKELTPAERKSLFFHHYGPIAAQLEQVKEQQAEYKRLRKIAKADGIVLADIDFAMRCAEVDDAGIIPDQLKRQAEIAAWFALPVEFQSEMFGNFEREPGEERAGREGRAAGASGVGGNPYDENSPMGRAWAKEWASEQEKAREALQTAMEKRNAAKAPETEIIKGDGGGEPDFPDNDDQPGRQAAE